MKYFQVRSLRDFEQVVHRLLPAALRSNVLPDQTHSASELSEKLRIIREQGLVALGPVEPLGPDGKARAGVDRLHLWVIGDPELDYAGIRQELGKHRIPVRFHSVEHPGHALSYLSETARPPVHAMVFGLNSKKQEPKQLLLALRKRREFRETPAFVCDTRYCSDRSRELYAAGTNGYLCGGATSRQLVAGLLRGLSRASRSTPTGT